MGVRGVLGGGGWALMSSSLLRCLRKEASSSSSEIQPLVACVHRGRSNASCVVKVRWQVRCQARCQVW